MGNTVNAASLISPAAPAAPHQRDAPAAGPPYVRFRSERVQPPSNVYIVTDDVFHVVFNAALTGSAAAQVTISGRVLEPDGRIVPFSYQYPISFSNSNLDQFIRLTEGFLLSLTAQLTGGSVPDGYLFVTVDIVRGFGAAQLVMARLIAGPVSATSVQSWPQSRLRETSEVPGALFVNPGTITPSPLFAQFRDGVVDSAEALTLSLDLSTSAVAGNRFLQLQLPINVAHGYLKTSPAAIPASTNVHCSWSINDSSDQAAIVQGTLASVLPQIGNIFGDEISVNVIGAQPGDAITNAVGLWRGYV